MPADRRLGKAQAARGGRQAGVAHDAQERLVETPVRSVGHAKTYTDDTQIGSFNRRVVRRYLPLSPPVVSLLIRTPRAT
jgi:hypothetical protein